MHSLRGPIAVATVMSVLAVPAFAGQRGNSGNHGPSTHPTPTHPNGPANAGPKTKGPGAGPSAKGNGSGSHGPANSGTSAKHTGSGSPHKSGTTTTTTSATGTPTAVNFNTTPVGAKLTKNVALQSKLATRLTALGYGGTVFEGAYGFKNLGQFVAATNVSKNLGIPFEQLKLQMTGLTVDATGKVLRANLNPDGTISLVDPANVTNAAPTKSLGQSIQTLKPTANATAAATAATNDADVEIEHTTTTTSKGGKKKS